MDKQQIQQMVREEITDFFKRLHQSDIPPQVIKQRHIEAQIIFFGLAADLPANGDTQILAYYATNTNVLYLWDGTTWQAH